MKIKSPNHPIVICAIFSEQWKKYIISTLRLAFFLLLCLFPFIKGTAQTPTPGHNWVQTKTYKAPVTSSQSVSQNDKVKTEITYYDGLGRPIQQVAYKQGGEGGDLITHMEYDDLGRQEKEYLPYARGNTSLDFNANALSDTESFYSAHEFGNTDNPYSQKEFEPSPLNRVLKQAASGEDWEMGSGHEVKTKYQANAASEVHYFTATPTSTGLPTLTYNGTYPANQLYKTSTYDENNSNSVIRGSVVEFTDKLGRVVLKRHYTTNSGRVGEISSTKTLDTYYVYDDHGNLSVVIPPKLSEQITSGGVPANLLDHLGYQYAYDHRNRLIRKKLPGRLTEYISYDVLDRPIARGPVLSPFGDGTTGTIRTKYDQYGRVAYTLWISSWFGESSLNSPPRALNYETQTETNTVNGVEFGYTNDVEPTTGYHVLTVNYYDNYDWPGAPATIPSNVGDGDSPVYYDKSQKPMGLPTGTWTRILTDENTTDAKVSHTLYDEKARAVRTRTDYPQGGYTQVDTKFNFVGNALYTITKHKKGSGTVQTLRDTYAYNDQERLVTHKHQIGSDPEQLLAKNEYDALGQLISKKTGGTETNYYQKVDYKYNVRGWLTDINNIGNLSSSGEPNDLFAFKINYTDVTDDINGQVKELYNGNIAETIWRTSSDNIKRKYGYSYDYSNRLLDAWYQIPGASNPLYQSYDEHLTYDSNGNIETLLRNGSQEIDGMPLNIDDLFYSYDQGNKLKSVRDDTSSPDGFKDVFEFGKDDFGYDDFGNLNKDLNKGITDIVYNHLNLPTKVTFGTDGDIDYLYGANGVKLEKTVTEGSNDPITTAYREGFQYKDDELDFFPTAEGYVKVLYTSGIGGGSTASYNYVFNYTDHLGNIRVRYAMNPDPNNQKLTILEEDHYYPFGLTHTGYNDDHDVFDLFDSSTIVLTPVTPLLGDSYKYGFGGKELQDELGLGLYDVSARNYDPALGRWMNIDPLAEKMRRHSPYNYAFDNPVFFIDPDGMEPCKHGDCPDPPSEGSPPPVDSSLSGADATRSVSVWSGYTGIATDNLRKSYKGSLSSNTTSSQRSELKTKMQSKEPALTKAVRESKRPASKESGMPKNNPSKTNAKFDKAAKTMGTFGKVGILTGIAASSYNITTAENKGEAVAKEAGGWAGAIAGGEMGATAGSSGGPWAALAGGIVGSIFGGIVGGEAVNSSLGPQNPAMSRNTSISEDIDIGDLNSREMIQKHSCFIKGTKILMSDGSQKNIQDIKKGDEILSVDIENRIIEPDIVLEIPTKIKKYRRIIARFDNGVQNEFSPAHPYYVLGKGWSVFDIEEAQNELSFKVSKIEIGDFVYYFDKGVLKTSKITYLEDTNEFIEMYNVENVKKNHTFFANSILVHNKYMAEE